jgi:chromosome segregation ATPase
VPDPTNIPTPPQVASLQKAKTEPASASYLETLKITLANEQAELDKRTTANAVLKADLDTAEKAEKDVEQAIGAYGQVLSNLKKDKDVADEYENIKLQRAAAAIGESSAKAIDGIIAQDDAQTKSLQDELERLPKQLQQAEMEYRQAINDLATAKKALDDAKAYPAKQTENLKVIKELISKAEKEDPTHPANIYFLSSEIKNLNKNTDLTDPKNFGGELRQALRNFNVATDKVRDKKQALDNKGIDFNKGQKTLTERKDKGKRMERILKAIDKFNDEPPSNTSA